MPRAVDPLISACEDILKHHRVPSFYVCTGIQGISLRPAVRVQGLRDLLALPLSPSQHLQLRARYGKARIVPASKVTIENQDAFVTALVDSVVGKIESVLGIQTTDVGAVLSHLCIDTSGGASMLHALQGCVNNAFGTLIVLLPSGHSGGVLTFQHKDRSMTLPGNVADVAKGFDGIFINTMMTSTPITSGRRLALVFHLTGVHKTPTGPSRLPLNSTGRAAELRTLANGPLPECQRIACGIDYLDDALRDADEKCLDDYDFHKPYEQYSEEEDEPLFPQLWSKHAHLADLLVATGCFDVALVRSTESEGDENEVDTSAYGWPRLSSAFHRLLRRWLHTENQRSSVPALLSHLAGLPKEAPRCLEQPFFGSFLKACWYDVQSHSPFADGTDAHCLLLDWHFETISPDLVHCDWLGDRLPLALVATIDAFLRPRRFGSCAGPCSRDVGLWRLDHVPIALMTAIESQPGVPTTPYTDAIVHALDAIPVAHWPWRPVCEFTSAQGAALLSCMHLCNRVDPALLDVLVALCSENESKSNSSDHAVVKFFQAQPRVLVLDAAVTSRLVAFLLTNAAMLPELVKRSTRWWTLDAYAQLVADEILATPVGDCVLARVQAWVATLPSTPEANRQVVFVALAKLYSEKSLACCRSILGWLATTCREAFLRSGTLEPVAGINDCVLDDIFVNYRHCAECNALHRFLLDGTKVQRQMRRRVCPHVHATATAHDGWLRLEPERIDGHWATRLRKVQQAGRMPIADAARANKDHAHDTKCVRLLQAVLAHLETTVA
ncbi:hypothetical protein SPRG_10285 [Saprolegnia parasitica CBS 223.65]|uniref:Uncharacterized protein n=1 Tax=Saprolegnia parasitica (strain CBS 223.65) TaxID=695850 RepID=A0A067C0Z2_SAPPC|nr:hypothetical protein SPRG_10285 [Saprolegnia parasitica CBS 223.65]KDO24469.1 hypothetical protein SPRG_10285 [Saprolegnia parasitica CBS 223.65]|eukprot:XP_012204735.1 hypothetical protein SPRG_10285 [Saprolegnia parasitica CBS 223.65]